MEFHVMIRINIRFLFLRNGVSFKTISGEMSAVTEEMTASWNKTTLPTSLSNYKLENVFNLDEFGLPYRCLPTKHITRLEKTVPEGKITKLERQTWQLQAQLGKRNGISFKTISGEMSAVTEEMTASWNKTTLPTSLSNYKLENVFNIDEFGLPYQCLPAKTYHPPGENCSGGKNNKAWATDMAAASTTGEK